MNNGVISINNINYQCINFDHHKVSNTEHLHICVDGELKCDRNKLHINYKKDSYFGYKIFPKTEKNETTFIVYIFQKGDKELL